MKNLFLICICFAQIQLFSQLPDIISSDDMIGHYIAITTDNNGNYFALNQSNTLYEFTLDGTLKNTKTYECGFICEFVDVEIAPDGTKYFASTFDGLFKEENGELVNILSDKLSKLAINSIGDIFVLGNAPAASFIFQIYKNGSWEVYDKNNSPFESNWVYDVVVDKDDTFWIAGEDGLFSFKDGVFKRYSESSIFQVSVNQLGIVSVAFSGAAIGFLNPGSTTINKLPWQEAIGRFAFQDANGNMYVGDGEDVHIRKQNEWNTVDLMDIGATGFISREMFMDKEGNVLYSLDYQKEIYLWRGIQSNVVNIDELQVNVAPNPASDFINIVNEGKHSIDRAILFDSMGKIVMQTNSGFMEVNTLPQGFYLLNIVKEGKEAFVKVSIIR